MNEPELPVIDTSWLGKTVRFSPHAIVAGKVDVVSVASRGTTVDMTMFIASKAEPRLVPMHIQFYGINAQDFALLFEKVDDE